MVAAVVVDEVVGGMLIVEVAGTPDEVPGGAADGQFATASIISLLAAALEAPRPIKPAK